MALCCDDSPLDCVLFDLDDTLYPSSLGISQACKRNIDEFLAMKCGVSADEASSLRIDLFKNYGSSLAGLMALGYDVHPDDYHSFVHGLLPYERIRPDPQLRELLLSIPQTKIIFTNSDRKHAIRVLERLGIEEECFHKIICFETLNPGLLVNRQAYASFRPPPAVVLKPFNDAVEAAIGIAGFDPHRMMSGDERPRRSLDFLRRTKKLVSRHRPTVPDPDSPSPTITPGSSPATQSTPSPATHSSDPFPPFYNYPPSSAYPPPPPTYPHPPHTYPHQPPPTYPGYYYTSYPPGQSSSYPPIPPPPSDPSPSAVLSSSTPPAPDTQDGQTLIEPDGETFYPHKMPVRMITEIIRGNFNAPYISWKQIPVQVRDLWFREFEQHFYWMPCHRDKVRKNFERRASARLRDMFTDLRKTGQKPLWISDQIWPDLVRAWGSEAFVKKREQNKLNRASDSDDVSCLQTGGSIPFTEHRRRLKKSLGREPTIPELHARTHQRQETSTWVDDRARRVHEEYLRLLEEHQQQTQQSQTTHTEHYSSEFSMWSKVVGGPKKGRMYGLGSQAPVYGSQGASTSQGGQRSFQDLEERLRVLEEWKAQHDCQQNAERAREEESARAEEDEDEETASDVGATD